MGGCSAPNCSNSTSIGKQLFRFPKDPVRKKKWVVNCRRDFEPTAHSRLCQDHFEQSQFEEIARSPAGGRKLKPNAIPTLFSVGEPPYPAVTTPYILMPLKPEPVEKELNFGDHGYARRTPLPGMDEEDGDMMGEDQQPCTQCQLLKKQLEQEMQHTARLRELGYPLPSYRTLCNRLETKIMVTTDMSCEELAELGLGLVATCDSPTQVVGDNDEEELIGVLS